jgi:putative hydrolase
MKYDLDLHTHTIASGHAYTTLLENIKEASGIGLKFLGTSDHGPNMPGGPHLFYFANMRVLPRELYGVTLLHGCEVNIVDYDGKLDIPEKILKNLDFVIASLHDVCIKPGTRDENTNCLIKVMENPLVDIIGHSGNPAFPIWEEEIVKKAKENNVLIEINNGSFSSRRGSEKNCMRIATLCKEYGVNIVLGSDAHTCFHIGKFLQAENMLKDMEMPEELIMNRNSEKLIGFLKNKGKLKDLTLD